MMKKITLQTQFSLYEQPSDLPDPDANLLALAKKALSLSYSPYSNFRVGAAIRTRSGATLQGANYENAAYPLCLCAEQAVLAAAASQLPADPVSALAITVDSANQIIKTPAAPCGACRQVICETESRNQHPIRLVLQGAEGPIFLFESGKELLPLAFDGSFI